MQHFLDFAEETRLVEEGRRKEGKGGRSGATDTGGSMRELKNSFTMFPRETQDLSVIVNNRSMQELQRTSSIFFNDLFINLMCTVLS